MSGQIFICYRRNDSRGYTGRIHDHLVDRFSLSRIFMDVANIEPGMDFVVAIETAISKCDVLIAVIGEQWLTASDKNNNRLLDNPEDYVRLEIATALKRNIRVIPVLLDNAIMPAANDLPDDLKLLTRKQTFALSHASFKTDMDRLVDILSKIVEPVVDIQAAAETPKLSKEELFTEIVACFKKIAPGEVTLKDQTTIRFPMPDKWYDVLIYLAYFILLSFFLSERAWILSALIAVFPIYRITRVRYSILLDVEKGILTRNSKKYDMRNLIKFDYNYYLQSTSWWFVFAKENSISHLKIFRVRKIDNEHMHKLIALLRQYYGLPADIPVKEFKPLFG